VSRPVVGITATIERARYGAWGEPCDLVPRVYTEAVQAAGATVVLLPPDDAVAEQPEPLLERIDALLLSGGRDVDPLAYGARPHPRTQEGIPERDRFELALVHAALERDMPVLGICRGMQLLNVACGGTLLQHAPDVVGDDRHLHTPGSFADHEVELEPGTLAARAVGARRTAVKSHHHQGIEELGEGLAISGRSAGDELPEAIEAPERAFALGVLWHPEADERSRVIGALVEAARAGVRA
jgi:putative glutamine amidotransferase